MSRVLVHGLGAVSPAGWGVRALCNSLQNGDPLPTAELARPGWDNPLRVHPVPAPATRPAFLAHPRLRRASVISQHAVGAAVEALGSDCARAQSGELRVGIVMCLMAGCVTYSRRFYEEVLKDPSVASPLLFPETVFNAPGSHLAAYLNSRAPNYTLVGDDTSFLQGLAVAADWLAADQVDGCLVLGVEELDWLVADALRHFPGRAPQGAGAGAIYLRSTPPASRAAELAAITDVISFENKRSRAEAIARTRAQLPSAHSGELLCLSTRGAVTDKAEAQAWRDWSGKRIAPKEIFGEAFTAAAAWQCIVACDALNRNECTAASISVVGVNQNTAAARFIGFNPATTS